MANIPLQDIASILESDLFADGSEFRLAVENEFRHIATQLVRNALSKAMLHAETSDPTDSDLVTGLTQYWINTSSGARFISVAGADWVDVTPQSGNQLTDEQFQDKLNSLITAGSNITITYDDQNNTFTIAATATTDGTGNLTAEEVRDTIAAFLVGGTNVTVTHDDENDTLTIAATDTNTQLTDEEFQDKLNSLITAGSNITITYDDAANTFTIAATGGGNGLASVATDDTLTGDGTSGSQLGIANDGVNRDHIADDAVGAAQIDADSVGEDHLEDSAVGTNQVRDAAITEGKVEDGAITPPKVSSDLKGKIGRIRSIGSYTLSASATPGAQNAGYTGGNLYIHTTASDGDASTILEGLAQGDYIYIGAAAIVEITADPTSAASVYTFAVNVLEGTVPTSESHTLYYLKESRAMIGGAVHGFHIANGAVMLAHFAAEVLTNWLSAVASGDALTGDGTSGSLLDIADRGVLARHLHLDAIKDNGPTSLGSWQRDNSNGSNSGTFHPFSSQGPVQVYINVSNTDGTNRREALLSLRSGDKLSVAGTALTLTATPTHSSGTVEVVGTWADNQLPSTSNGQTYAIIDVSKDILGTNLRTAGTFLGVDENLNLIWDTPQAGSQSDETNTDDSGIGEYTDLGEWTWVSTSAPATGQFYVESGEVRIFDTNVGGTQVTSLATVAVGDRFQFGELNAFEVTAAGTPAGNTYWTFTGEWTEVFDVGDFDGNYTIYHIKKDDVLVRNRALKNTFLKLNDALMVEVHDPADSLETIWEGSASAGATYSRSLNAGKKFGDYKNIIFEFNGSQRRTAQSIPRSVFVEKEYIEISNRTHYLDIRYRSDTQFSVAGGHTQLTLYKVYGQKGV